MRPLTRDAMLFTFVPNRNQVGLTLNAFFSEQRFQSPWSLELWIGLSDHYQILTSYSRSSFQAKNFFFQQILFILQPKNDHFFSGKTQFFVQKSAIL